MLKSYNHPHINQDSPSMSLDMLQDTDTGFADKTIVVGRPSESPSCLICSCKSEDHQQDAKELTVIAVVATHSATEEEKGRLQYSHSLASLPATVYTIAFIQFCSCFALYGFSGVFQNYLQNPLPSRGLGTGAPASINDSESAGALDRGEAVAVGMQNMFWCLVFFFPILGAVIADSKWGRYKTITVFSIISLIGFLIITVTSIPSLLKSGAGFPGWVIGSVFVSLGIGAINCE